MRRTVALFVAPWSVALAQVQPKAPVAVDSVTLLDTLSQATRRFLLTWQTAWTKSEEVRMDKAPAGEKLSWYRRINLHCHYDHSLGRPWPGPVPGVPDAPSPNMIRSRTTARTFCPSWPLDTIATLPDEQLSIDAPLISPHLDSVRRARRALVLRLDSAAMAFPTNGWIVGQRVRFLLDAGEPARAFAVATNCRALPAWCFALTGYVHFRMGDLTKADWMFAATTAALVDMERCEWTDARELLDPDARRIYEEMSCAQRDLHNVRLWWMSDPLFVTPGNERRAEHFARKVTIALRSAVEQDGRFDWRPNAGADALRELAVRYGLPSFAAWGGPNEDDRHSNWLDARKTLWDPLESTCRHASLSIL